ncbi:MAG TPA: hypothetical protein VLW65_25355 [Bryobacteraceae bacterium]|nr:hypothetical protein [Bryobacteraceae bacterium]
MSGTDLADPARLALLHASFRLADQEHARRFDRGTSEPPAERTGDSPDGEAVRLAAILRSHFASLDRAELEKLRSKLGRSLLVELDRKMAVPGVLPGKRLDPARLRADRSSPDAISKAPRVALVSLPWMSPALPSIQLATLASALQSEGIDSDVHELYVDYAARIGLNVYNHLANLTGFLPEWIFTRHYYGPETGDELSAMMAQRPLKDSPWPGFADVVLQALDPVTETYLTDMVDAIDWSGYDVVGSPSATICLCITVTVRMRAGVFSWADTRSRTLAPMRSPRFPPGSKTC